MNPTDANTPNNAPLTDWFEVSDITPFIFHTNFAWRTLQSVPPELGLILGELGAAGDPSLLLACSLTDVKAATQVAPAVCRQSFIASYLTLRELARRRITIPQELSLVPVDSETASSFHAWAVTQVSELTTTDSLGEATLKVNPTTSTSALPQTSTSAENGKLPRSSFQLDLLPGQFFTWVQEFEQYALINVTHDDYTTPTYPDEDSSLPKSLQRHLKGVLSSACLKLPISDEVRGAARGTDALRIIYETYNTPASRTLEKQRLRKLFTEFKIAGPSNYEAATTRFNTIVNRLATMGDGKSEMEVVEKWLEVVPPEYDAARLQIIAQLAKDPNITWHYVTTQLRAMTNFMHVATPATTTTSIPVNQVKQGTKRKQPQFPSSAFPFHRDYSTLGREEKREWTTDRRGYAGALEKLGFPNRGDSKAAGDVTLRDFERKYAGYLTAHPKDGGKAFATFTDEGA